MKTLALTTVQDQLFQIINQVLQTGTAVEVEHQGRKVRIAAVPSPPSVTERLAAHPLITQTIDFETPTEWTWNEMKNLSLL